MYNPFGLLSMRLLQALLKSGNRYFVRQTYKRGLDQFDETQRGAFLFTHYTDAGRAQMHYDALALDPNRFLYDSTDAEHYNKLEIAAHQPLGFRIYSPLLEKEWKPTEAMNEKIRKYIAANFTWTPGRNDKVKADLFSQVGELFVNLKYRVHEVKVPLADIEKY
jgi:hypothetical protein